MDVKVDIKSEDINKMVSDAILNSVLGVAIKDNIEKAIAKYTNTYDSALQNVIRKHIDDIIFELLDTTYKNKITEIIKNSISENMVAEITMKAFEKLKNY